MGLQAELLAALSYAGIGAGLGTVGAAVVRARSEKGPARAQAADLVTNAAGNLADRLNRMNATLEGENAAMRRAIIALTDIMDQLVPLLPDEGARLEARRAIKSARMALR